MHAYRDILGLNSKLFFFAILSSPTDISLNSTFIPFEEPANLVPLEASKRAAKISSASIHA